MAACQDLFEHENVSNEELEGLLFQSCRDGQRDVVDRLLSKGVRLDVKNKDGRSPLVVSSMSGWEDIVTLILDQGVDVRNEDGSTALMGACKIGHWKVVKILAERGASVTGRRFDGNTALMWACKKGHDKVVEILIEYHSDLNERDADGTSAFMWACIKGHATVVEILIEHVSNLNERDEPGTTAFMWACINGHNKVVELLIELVSDVNERDHIGRTPLMWACVNGREKVFEILMEPGASVDVTDRLGATPLILGCRGAHVAIVESLIEQGVEVNVGDNEGITPLMRACNIECHDFMPQNDSPTVVMLLLKHGANVDTQDMTHGMSAVMMAAMNNNVVCLQALLTLGPNLDLVDREGKTVFSHARENTECLRILLEDGKLLHGGKLKSIHKNSNIDDYCRQTLLIAIEFGVFEWEWCPHYHFKPVTLAAIKSGLSPGKIKYNTDTYLSPLIISILKKDTELTETILDRLYYYPEDYRTLCTDMDVRGRVENRDILDKITLQPLSLQTWCYLNISKAVSTTCFPVKRRERVDALQIPDKFKRRLNFE